jgi:cysteine-rich repeat protein
MQPTAAYHRGVRWVLAVIAIWMGASCVQSTSVTCEDGRTCPAGYSCDDAHGGCASPKQIEVCANGEETCLYPGVPDGRCFDGVCLPFGCGNGVVTPPEMCDDGNRAHGDGCSADCLSNETCGNGIVDTLTETCDDGNTENGDGCQGTCQGPFCGDGIVDDALHEECDDGALLADLPDACRTTCRLPVCGDEIVDTGEACDDENHISGDGCSADCKSLEVCGNYYPDFIDGEVCDDNDLSHDGCGGCQFESPRWTEQRPLPVRYYPLVAYDAARGRTVVFGGVDSVTLGDTWEWNGSGWLDVTPATNNPPPRDNGAMAYDAARRRVVLFGGSSGVASLNDTWEWDGNEWRNVTPPLAADSPGARESHRIAYDAARERIVLFGGRDAATGQASNQTWEWNGSVWTNVTPASGNPPARTLHALAYDPVRGRVVLFGGVAGSRAADTWEWNGTSWTNVTPASGNPVARFGHALAFDANRARVVLHAGNTAAGLEDDTWEWDGTAWTDVTPATGNPAARTYHALAFDTARGRLISVAGFTTAPTNQTLEWNGSAWSDRTPVAPSARSSAAITYASAAGHVIMFGGNNTSVPFLNETWRWDGGWTNVTPASGNPPGRFNHALAYDSARDRVVLFGGFNGSRLGDTWEWNGSAWASITPVGTPPAAREGHALVYDIARRRVVMFGGQTGGPAINETWEWDGTTWTNVTPATGNPPARVDHALAYDALRQRVVLFGGAVSAAPVQDTWEWDGTSWTQRTPVTQNPPTRKGHHLAYDAARARVVMFGGTSTTAPLADTWEWDGAVWNDVTPLLGNPPARHSAVLVYDPVLGRTLAFGGLDAASARLGDAWTLRYGNTSAAGEGCHFGVDADGDGKLACADADCFGACAPSCSPVAATCDMTLPRCGDGECQPVESARLCPGDCGMAAVVCGDFLCEPPETIASCPGDCS